MGYVEQVVKVRQDAVAGAQARADVGRHVVAEKPGLAAFGVQVCVASEEYWRVLVEGEQSVS